ncbi:MAG: DNA repair protein RadA [Candidatus Dormibacteria bacterium]
MPRQNSVFTCQQCGHQAPRWEGRCGACGEWNTLVEERQAAPARPGARRAAQAPVLPPALDSVPREDSTRIPSGLGEVDRVLGGGIVPGSLVLLGGDPGIGKSTLLLQVAMHLAAGGRQVLYASGEESLPQVRLRAERLGPVPAGLRCVSETDVDRLVAAARTAPFDLVVVDSIQTCFRADLGSAPGSVGQVRESAAELMRFAKDQGPAVVLVGHVTKEGTVAGPRVLEHMVDAVAYLEGENGAAFRVLHAVKNRFGATGEIGLLEMTGAGLVELSDPGRAFVSSDSLDASGTAVVVSLEGARPLLVEVQALVAPTPFGLPRRSVNGMDSARLHMLVAVLERRGGVRLGQADIFVNVAGGVRLQEPAADLAVALAIASSQRDGRVGSGTVVLGEVGLTGEIRPVAQAGRRLAEAVRLGFDRAIVPERAAHEAPAGLRVVPVRTIREALEAALAMSPVGA